MPRPDHSRPALVATAATLLRRQGYAATGLAQVLAESGASTGSLYHHFPDGKEALAEAAVDAAGAEVAASLERLLGTPGDVSSVVAKWCRGLAGALAADPRDGCPIAPTAIEAVNGSQRLRAATARAFESWRLLLADRLRRDGWPQAAADEDATALLALIEGAILLSRTSGDSSPLHTVAGAATRLLAGRH